MAGFERAQRDLPAFLLPDMGTEPDAAQPRSFHHDARTRLGSAVCRILAWRTHAFVATDRLRLDSRGTSDQSLAIRLTLTGLGGDSAPSSTNGRRIASDRKHAHFDALLAFDGGVLPAAVLRTRRSHGFYTECFFLQTISISYEYRKLFLFVSIRPRMFKVPVAICLASVFSRTTSKPDRNSIKHG